MTATRACRRDGVVRPPRRWLVLSPHCDDAVLSLGARLSGFTREGGEATVVTLLAGDPRSDAPPGPWDRAAGFATEGEAARVRRREDEAACAELGVKALHLDGRDEQYRRDDDEGHLWEVVHALAQFYDLVLVPAHPLQHDDHRRLAQRAAVELADRVPVWVYAEEPYLLRSHSTPPDHVEGLGELRWARSPGRPVDVARKARALSRYRSQLPLLAGRRTTAGLLAQLALRARAGEWLGAPAV